MNVLLVGSGAREHTLAWKLRQSPKLTDLFIAPGNAGTAGIATNVDVRATDLDGIVAAAKKLRIDLVIIGPEGPLALGLADRLAVEGIATFGPTQAAARIESSKAFSKDLMVRHGIPTGRAQTFNSRIEAHNYVERVEGGLVVKADGLAQGKGVFVCDSKDEALEVIDRVMGDEHLLGAAGNTVLIEELLTGREVSAMAFTDGTAVAPMPFSCDYKRAETGDVGPNTGGMGAYSPPMWLDEALEPYIHENITEATIAAMLAEGTPFRGVLYPGLMVTPDGVRVIEFNARFGDPETQVLIPRLKSDLLDICWAVANNRLADAEIEWSTEATVGVVMVSGGYPDDFTTGHEIAGLRSVDSDVLVFHGGTELNDEGAVVTSGGRVLTVVASGASLTEARAKVYANIKRIHFSKAYYRQDIAAPSQNARVD